MPLTITKQKDVRGRSLKRFLASTRAHDVLMGAIGESATSVQKRATELLVQASELYVLEVRTVSPGENGAAADVWILHGDPIKSYQYGRVYAYGGPPGIGSGQGKPTLHCTTMLTTHDPREALTAMLSHMADNYAEELWPQFLWSSASVNIQAIRTEIEKRNAERAAMVASK